MHDVLHIIIYQFSLRRISASIESIFREMRLTEN